MKWLSEEEWKTLMRGENCPMCDDMNLPENVHSLLITELRQSYVRFARNQYMRGLD